MDVNTVWQSPRGAAKAGCLLQLTWTQREHVNKSPHYIIRPLFFFSLKHLLSAQPIPLQALSRSGSRRKRSPCLIPQFRWCSRAALALLIPLLLQYRQSKAGGGDSRRNFLKCWTSCCESELLDIFQGLANIRRFCTSGEGRR